MSRPVKDRHVCCMPQLSKFSPTEMCFKSLPEDDVINMSIEEYEVIRLIDYEGLTQEEAATQMNVARTTVQAIYAVSRKKLADMLIDGKYLHIKGGNYKLCPKNHKCNKGECSKEKALKEEN